MSLWHKRAGVSNTWDLILYYVLISSSPTNSLTLYLSGLGQFGQAWYVNGDLAPDLYLVRGQKYTFIVEGGLGTDQEGIIHPFYLTSDNEGGYGTKSDYEARVGKNTGWEIKVTVSSFRWRKSTEVCPGTETDCQCLQ